MHSTLHTIIIALVDSHRCVVTIAQRTYKCIRELVQIATIIVQ
jgi:hypothetical protein